MDLQSRFNEIKKFLHSHFEFIEREPLDFFPEGLPSPYLKWTSELKGLDENQLIELETNLVSDEIGEDLLAFYKEVARLSSLPIFKAAPAPLDQNMTRGMTEKKRHEVAMISGMLKDREFTTLIDVGSGKGHLSAVLMEHKNKARSICVDMDETLQESGRQRLKRQLPHLKNKIEFQNATFDKNFKSINADLVLSLHSCGDLSVDAMEYALKNKASLINFGCCYHKLSKTNLSKFAQERPLNFGFHALNLATRSHRAISLESFRQRSKVKRYRYAFHALSYEDGQRSFAPLGNARHQFYDGEFKSYCQMYSPWPLKGDLNQRFCELQKSKMMEQYMLAEALRGPLGRLLEIYIVLDRAIWLKENGANVEVGTVFDRSLSPRNILIKFDV